MIKIAKSRTTSLGYKNLTISILREKSSYLFLGAFVIGVVIILSWVFLTNQGNPTLPNLTDKTNISLDQPIRPSGTYTVRAGDNLWILAENTYGSGYNYLDIAKANNIVNPDLILVGQELRLPVVIARTPTKGDVIQSSTAEVTFKGDLYTVKSGDHLWKVALEAYGDGYAWTKIANANNLKSPNLIYPNTKLSIPR